LKCPGSSCSLQKHSEGCFVTNHSMRNTACAVRLTPVALYYCAWKQLWQFLYLQGWGEPRQQW
jgi:hypothetical protein